jgi:hypothetical protein
MQRGDSPSRLLKACLHKVIRMVVSARCDGLPGNVRNSDSSFGLKTKQLNHGDSQLLEELCSLSEGVELLVTLTLPPSGGSGNNNNNDIRNSRESSPTSSSKIILEHWRLQFSQRNRKKADMTEKMLVERLMIGIRSIHALLSILPAFSFLRGPSLRYEDGKEIPPCRMARLSASGDSGGSGSIGGNRSKTEGVRFEQIVGVPHSMSGSSKYGVLHVDVIKSNLFNGTANKSAFTAECIDIPLSYGVLRVEVDYRRNIETTNIETPHIIHDYYVSNTKTTNNNNNNNNLKKKREERDRVRANSKPVAIPGANRGRVDGSGGIRARSLTSGSSLGSPPLNNLITGLNLLREESKSNHSGVEQLNGNQRNQQHHQHQHQHQNNIHPRSVPINIQKPGTSLLSMMMANADRGPGTPPLHPTRSPSLSPHLSASSTPSSIQELLSNMSSNITPNGPSSSPHSYGSNDYSSSYPTPPFLAGSAPRENSGLLMSPQWAGLPLPATLSASPPILGLGHHHMNNMALGGNGRTLSLQSYQPYHQQQQQQQRYPYGSTSGKNGSITRSISSNSLMNYMNGASAPGSGGGSGSGNNNTIYGSSPKTAASGWIEYTTTAGTAAPDSFSPWGKVLGVVAARSRAASKSATVAQKIGASYSTVDTSWLHVDDEDNQHEEHSIRHERSTGPLAVDAPSATDDLSRVGAFLQALAEHEERWNTIKSENNKMYSSRKQEVESSATAVAPNLQEILNMARQQVENSMKF